MILEFSNLEAIDSRRQSHASKRALMRIYCSKRSACDLLCHRFLSKHFNAHEIYSNRSLSQCFIRTLRSLVRNLSIITLSYSSQLCSSRFLVASSITSISRFESIEFRHQSSITQNSISRRLFQTHRRLARSNHSIFCTSLLRNDEVEVSMTHVRLSFSTSRDSMSLKRTSASNTLSIRIRLCYDHLGWVPEWSCKKHVLLR